MHDQTSHWVPVDSRRLLSTADAEHVARFVESVSQLEQLARRLPAVVHMMRDDMNGQPQAAAADRGDGAQVLWCWSHERSTRECDEAGELCTGELGRDISDPTGNAAVIPDRAKRDLAALFSRLDHLVSTSHVLLGLAAGYPTDTVEREQLGPDDEIGTVWCRSCWKDNKTCEPIALRKEGKPYYAGLCRWCGRTRALIGGNRLDPSDQRGDPPTWMVAKHHSGERITQGDIDKATKAVPKATSKKGRRRK